MTSEKKESILRKIQKLLALATSPNEHEAAAAAAKAQQLLFENKLSMADLSDIERQANDPLINEAFVIGNKAAKWRLSLAGACARGYGCEFCYMSSSKYGRKARVFFVGRKNDVEVAWYMYGYLANVLDSLAPGAYDAEFRRLVLARDFDSADAMTPLTWHNDFRMGAISVLRDRLKQSEDQFVNTNDKCRALMVVSKAEVARFFKQAHPKLRAGNGGRPIISDGAFQAGREAGKTIELRRGLTGSGKTSGPRAITGGAS